MQSEAPDGRVECQNHGKLCTGFESTSCMFFSSPVQLFDIDWCSPRSDCIYVDIGRGVSSCRFVNRRTSVLSTCTPMWGGGNMTRRMEVTAEISHL
jgi:hypothetical protein